MGESFVVEQIIIVKISYDEICSYVQITSRYTIETKIYLIIKDVKCWLSLV